MPLAYIPGRTYNSLIEVLAGRLNSTIYSFSTGKRACDTADDLTERLEAIFKASLSRKYVPSKYTLNQGRIISEKITSILIGIEKCTSVDSHSTSLQVIFMLATRFPNFHHYFTDKDVITRLLFDESKYNELIARKFGHKDQAMLKKLANITQLSLKEDVPSNGYARQLYLSLGGLDALDPDSTAPVKMLQSALTYDQMLIALSHLREWMHRLIKDEPTQTTNLGIELVCELSEKLVTVIKDTNQDAISTCLGSCVRRIFLLQQEGELRESIRLEVEETLKRISLAQCYELAWHLSRFLWEQYQRILSIQLCLIGWETKGMEKAEECVHIIRNTYAQAIEAICNMTH